MRPLKEYLSGDIATILDGLDDFLAAEVDTRHFEFAHLLSGNAATYDSSGCYVPAVRELISQVRQAAATAGYYTMCVPQNLGGGGMGFLTYYAAWEHMFRRCAAQKWLATYVVAHWTKGPSALLGYAQPEVRGQIMTGLMAGETSMCFAMSEVDAGSDLWQMKTRADRTDGGWMISGSKQWISGAPYADFAIIFAVTDRDLAARRKGGITAFLTPTSVEGFDVVGVTPMFGQIGSNEGLVHIDNLYVPDGWLLGDEGDGLRIAMQGVSLGRLYNAARAVGTGLWGLGNALDYTAIRKTFGHTLSEYQGITFRLADAATELHAARLMALDCAKVLDSGGRAVLELAMTKAYTTEVATRALDSVMQAHGATGFTNEVGIAEAWLHARRAQIADGAAEVMRRQIVQQLYATR